MSHNWNNSQEAMQLATECLQVGMVGVMWLDAEEFDFYTRDTFWGECPRSCVIDEDGLRVFAAYNTNQHRWVTFGSRPRRDS
jgi:hypothetical protein